jgi:transposase InsO family protein
MEVNRSVYYAYLQKKSQPKPIEDVKQAELVKQCFYFHRRRYGSRRIAKDLKIGRFVTRRLMREQNLKAIQPKSYLPKTTNSKHGGRISPNLLKDNKVEVYLKGQAIVGDITYLPLRNGKFCYLATFQDKYTRRIVGWAIAEEMTAELVVRALLMALRRGLIGKGAIIHTDRGSQYVSNLYRELLERHSLRQSMSGKGNCYDNAQAESFFGRFKTELVEGGVFEDAAQAGSETFSYIEGYYNRIRRHSGIGYLSPMEFERQLATKEKSQVEKLKKKERRRMRVVSSLT